MTDDDFREYITFNSWSLTCLISDCGWVAYGEGTENFIEEMHEAMDAHKQEHERGEQNDK